MLWKALINGIPVLEAVADTRAWEHLLENLEEEEKKYPSWLLLYVQNLGAV